jgi:hypothetical protein
VGFASEFNDLCPTVILWQRMTGRDPYGKPAYATAVAYRGRKVAKVVRVASNPAVPGGGADALSEAQVWILGTPAVGYDDRVYAQGETAFAPILSIQTFPDEEGNQFVKVLLGRSRG